MITLVLTVFNKGPYNGDNIGSDGIKTWVLITVITLVLTVFNKRPYNGDNIGSDGI